MTPKSLPKSPRKAIAHLRSVDPALARAIDAVGPVKLEPRPADLGALCRSIIGQQLSVVVANAIGGRFAALAAKKDGTIDARMLLSIPEEQLRAVGLSRAKVVAVRSLAEFWLAEELHEDRLRAHEDEDLIKLLTRVKGIGPWTVKMILIFSLNRPDVLPHEDLGLRAGLRRIHAMDEMPTIRQTLDLTAAWKPWSTVGTLYCWEILRVVE